MNFSYSGITVPAQCRAVCAARTKGRTLKDQGAARSCMLLRLLVKNFAVHRDRDRLPRDQLAAVLKRGFDREFQPAAARHLHPHDGDASDLVRAEDLRQSTASSFGQPMSVTFPRMNCSCIRA